MGATDLDGKTIEWRLPNEVALVGGRVIAGDVLAKIRCRPNGRRICVSVSGGVPVARNPDSPDDGTLLVFYPARFFTQAAIDLIRPAEGVNPRAHFQAIAPDLESVPAKSA